MKAAWRRALLLVAPLIAGACVVAAQPDGAAGAATPVVPLAVAAKVGYGQATPPQAKRLWSVCVDSVNTARAAAGSGPVQMDARAWVAAADQSTYQAQTQKMSHVGSDGSNGGARLIGAGYIWSTWGENIGAGQADCQTVVADWLTSASHRANLLNPAFRHIGIGMAIGANGVPYWTMDLAAGG